MNLTKQQEDKIQKLIRNLDEDDDDLFNIVKDLLTSDIFDDEKKNNQQEFKEAFLKQISQIIDESEKAINFTNKITKILFNDQDEDLNVSLTDQSDDDNENLYGNNFKKAENEEAEPQLSDSDEEESKTQQKSNNQADQDSDGESSNSDENRPNKNEGKVDYTMQQQQQYPLPNAIMNQQQQQQMSQFQYFPSYPQVNYPNFFCYPGSMPIASTSFADKFIPKPILPISTGNPKIKSNGNIFDATPTVPKPTNQSSEKAVISNQTTKSNNQIQQSNNQEQNSAANNSNNNNQQNKQNNNPQSKQQHKIYIKRLPQHFNQSKIEAHFAKFGKIITIEHQKEKNILIIKYNNKQSVQKAISCKIPVLGDPNILVSLKYDPKEIYAINPEKQTQDKNEVPPHKVIVTTNEQGNPVPKPKSEKQILHEQKEAKEDLLRKLTSKFQLLIRYKKFITAQEDIDNIANTMNAIKNLKQQITTSKTIAQLNTFKQDKMFGNVYDFTLLVKNIPNDQLSNEKINKRFETYGKLEFARIQLNQKIATIKYLEFYSAYKAYQQIKDMNLSFNNEEIMKFVNIKPEQMKAITSPGIQPKVQPQKTTSVTPSNSESIQQKQQKQTQPDIKNQIQTQPQQSQQTKSAQPIIQEPHQSHTQSEQKQQSQQPQQQQQQPQKPQQQPQKPQQQPEQPQQQQAEKAKIIEQQKIEIEQDQNTSQQRPTQVEKDTILQTHEQEQKKNCIEQEKTNASTTKQTNENEQDQQNQIQSQQIFDLISQIPDLKEFTKDQLNTKEEIKKDNENDESL